MSLIRKVAEGALAKGGIAVLKVPPMAGPREEAAPVQFFPTGTPKRGWDFVPEWDHCPLPWVKVLKEVYQDPASWPGSISPEGGSMLYWLVRNIQPKVIVETGTYLGVSTIWMAAALRAGKTAGGDKVIHAFDLFSDERADAPALKQHRLRGLDERLRRAELRDLVVEHKGDSASELMKAHETLSALGGVQLAYIDGDHTFKGACADLLAVEPVLQVGGYVILHDVFPKVCNQKGPRGLLKNLHKIAKGRYQKCDIYTAPLNYGIALLRRTA